MALFDKVQWIDAQRLNDREQRFRDAAIVRMAAAELRGGWDTKRVPPITIVIDTKRVNGKLEDVHRIIDGHHRYAAARTVGLREVPVLNWDALSMQERGAYVRAINRYRKRQGRAPRTLGELMGRGLRRSAFGALSSPPRGEPINAVRAAIRRVFPRFQHINEAVVTLQEDDRRGGWFRNRDEQRRARIVAVIYREYGLPDPYNDNAVEEWNRVAAEVSRALNADVYWESYNAGVLYLASSTPLGALSPRRTSGFGLAAALFFGGLLLARRTS